MKEVILIKNGEIALKGLNRSTFEEILIKNLKKRLNGSGRFKISRAQSTIYCEPFDESCDLDEAAEKISKVFGIAAFTRACVAEKDWNDIKSKAVPYLKDVLEDAKTFKVEAKRSDKNFSMKSPEICMEMGGELLEAYPHLSVDVHNPDVTVIIEIRDFGAYIHAKQENGAGGIPVGSGGRAALLTSGGIDSPVAGWMMAKRGLEITAIHFAAPPYTSERAKLKVITLCEKMSEYCGRIKLIVVPFTEIQENIREKCPEEYFTIIMRRYMMKIAEKIAQNEKCKALITGESLGQVASQTLGALACTDVACEMPVLRPLIGMDKEEIIRISRKIDTFETSILPYEDCCTVFTPRHPKTKPRLNDVLHAEEAFDASEMIETCVNNVEVINIG